MSSLTYANETPLHSIEQLVEWMGAGARPREGWLIGTEHEKFGWWLDRQNFPTFEGEGGIRQVFLNLMAQAGWEAGYEGDDIVVLSRGQARITLEPGGQFELSGAPLRLLSETEAELEQHLREVTAACADLNLIFSGLGVAPKHTPAQMPKMPKQRYQIMRSYLPTRGARALWMMHSTCTVQANLDFSDERDAMRKFRAALLVQPLVMAAFANSGIAEERVLPVICERGRIWEETDVDRWRFPDGFLEPTVSFRSYIEWALDVPMFFIHRDDHYIECTGLSFRRFMSEGYAGHTANLGDFELHLSTIFPDVRIKQFMEVRAADMGSKAQVLALPALHVGLLYDEAALDFVLERMGHIRAPEWWAARLAVPAQGLQANFAGRTVQDWLLDLLPVARAGVERWEAGSGRFLDELEQNVRAGQTPAQQLQARFEGEFKGDVNALMLATRIA